MKSDKLTLLAVVLSGNALAQTDYHFGGTIHGLLIHDTDVAGVGVNIPPNAIFGQSAHSDTKIDLTLSQLQFGSNTAINPTNSLSSKVVFDLNDANNGLLEPRLREAFFTWQRKDKQDEKGRLEVGQTWSTYMDMRNIPQSIAEPTLSGASFMRQPLVRWSQSFESINYQIAIENGTNQDIQKLPDELNVDTSGSLPDLVMALEWDGEGHWFRASSVLTQVRYSHSGITDKQLGYGVQLSAGLAITERDTLSALWNHGKGTERYLLGVAPAGPTWNHEKGEVELNTVEGFMAAYRRAWRENIRTTLAYGQVELDQTESQHALDYDGFRKTNYTMANVLWDVIPSMTLGLEYVYKEYERNRGEQRDNHRVVLGAVWRY